MNKRIEKRVKHNIEINIRITLSQSLNWLRTSLIQTFKVCCNRTITQGWMIVEYSSSLFYSRITNYTNNNTTTSAFRTLKPRHTPIKCEYKTKFNMVIQLICQQQSKTESSLLIKYEYHTMLYTISINFMVHLHSMILEIECRVGLAPSIKLSMSSNHLMLSPNQTRDSIQHKTLIKTCPQKVLMKLTCKVIIGDTIAQWIQAMQLAKFLTRISLLQMTSRCKTLLHQNSKQSHYRLTLQISLWYQESQQSCKKQSRTLRQIIHNQLLANFKIK